MTKTVTYAVEGSGPFPADMMRYDEASFLDASSEQAATVGSVDGLTVRVHLTTERSAYFIECMSAKRWHSFGWRITEVNGKPPAPIGLPGEQVPLEHLEDRLEQVWKDYDALRQCGQELTQQIAERIAEFKVGDVITTDGHGKGTFWEVTHFQGRENPHRGSGHSVEVRYTGARLKKDGKAGKIESGIWQGPLRKATPEELKALGRSA